LKLEAFVESVDLHAKSEIQKVKYLLYYFFKCEGLYEASTSEVRHWFSKLSLAQPNESRLMTNIRSSSEFIRGSSASSFRLHAKTIISLAKEIPALNAKTEEIVSHSTILPAALYRTANPRGYIVKLCDQINASYENNLFDACAVLMRRLLEVLLIHSYQHCGLESKILGPNSSFKELKTIIVEVNSTGDIALSRNTKTCLDSFRVLGNFAAHKITYNTTRDDIKNIALDFRAAVEELLYAAGLRK